MHEELCKNLIETYRKKNHDYGDSFGETYNKLGIVSAVTRISDKYNRLVSLCIKSEEERKVKDESIIDTLLDMANYCIMTVIELENDKTKRTENSSNCDHVWEYESTVMDINGCHECHRCAICGKTKTMKVMGL